MPDELSGATPTLDTTAAPVASAATPAAAILTPEATSDEARSDGAGATLWDRLFRNRGSAARSGAPAAEDAPPETPGASGAAKPGASGTAQPATPWTPPSFGSQAELDDFLERHGQSYADRRDATRAARDRTSRMSELERGIAQAHDNGDVMLVDELAGQLTDLKNGVKREEDQTAQTAQLVGRVANHFDRTVIDPIFAELPDARRAEIATAALKSAQDGGLDGVAYRQLMASEGLKALKDHYLAEGERRARSNPAFRQQVRAELRGSSDFEEPEHLVGVGAGAGKPDMNAFIRASLGRE